MAVPVRRDLLLQVLDRGRRLIVAIGRMTEERRLRLAGLARGLPDLRRRIDDLGQSLDDRGERLDNAWPNYRARRSAELAQLAARLRHPREQIAQKRHDLERQATRLDSAIRACRAAEISRAERDRLALAQTSSRFAVAMTRLFEVRRALVEQAGALLESYSYAQVLRRGFALVRDAAGDAVTSADSARPGDRWTVTFQGDHDVPVIVEGAKAPAKAHDGKVSPKVSDSRQGSLL
jgi:exodeoxyribonuclease VII large subunit